MTDREAMQQALEALELLAWCENPATRVQVRKPRNGGPIVTVYPHKVATEAAAPLRERLTQPEQEPVAVTDNTYGYAKSLAEAIFKQHFASDEHYASGQIVWGVNDTVIGILTQIDNMVADMVRRPAQPEQEPVAHTLNCVCGAVWDVSPDGVEEMVHAPNPPQRKPLTAEQLEAMAKKYVTNCYFDTLKYARAIEVEHGIKGGA